jgi:hypothetical protein
MSRLRKIERVQSTEMCRVDCCVWLRWACACEMRAWCSLVDGFLDWIFTFFCGDSWILEGGRGQKQSTRRIPYFEGAEALVFGGGVCCWTGRQRRSVVCQLNFYLRTAHSLPCEGSLLPELRGKQSCTHVITTSEPFSGDSQHESTVITVLY